MVGRGSGGVCEWWVVNTTSCEVDILAKKGVVKPRLWSTFRGVRSIGAQASAGGQGVWIEEAGESWTTSRLVSPFPALGERGKSGVLAG